jgi:hypothetical protein
MLEMALEAKSSLLSKHDAPSRPPTALEQTLGDPGYPSCQRPVQRAIWIRPILRRGRHEISSASGLGQCSGALLHIPGKFQILA